MTIGCIEHQKCSERQCSEFYTQAYSYIVQTTHTIAGLKCLSREKETCNHIAPSIWSMNSVIQTKDAKIIEFAKFASSWSACAFRISYSYFHSSSSNEYAASAAQLPLNLAKLCEWRTTARFLPKQVTLSNCIHALSIIETTSDPQVALHNYFRLKYDKLSMIQQWQPQISFRNNFFPPQIGKILFKMSQINYLYRLRPLL